MQTMNAQEKSWQEFGAFGWFSMHLGFVSGFGLVLWNLLQPAQFNAPGIAWLAAACAVISWSVAVGLWASRSRISLDTARATTSAVSGVAYLALVAALFFEAWQTPRYVIGLLGAVCLLLACSNLILARWIVPRSLKPQL